LPSLTQTHQARGIPPQEAPEQGNILHPYPHHEPNTSFPDLKASGDPACKNSFLSLKQHQGLINQKDQNSTITALNTVIVTTVHKSSLGAKPKKRDSFNIIARMSRIKL